MKLPIEFVEKYQNLLGSDSEAFFESFDNNPIHGFRVNSLKDSAINLNEKKDFPIKNISNGYYGKINGNNIDHLAGLIYSQDPSAMNVAQFANPEPGEKVLDLCAAPGGKTTQLATLMEDTGLLVANEINNKRSRILSSNVERWGLKHTLVINNSPNELETTFKNYFDKIVVDAPCSGEGLFRKDPDAMKYWSLDYVKECSNRQKKILESAVKMLRPGGKLTYSTCTFSPEENEQNMNWLENNLGMKIIPLNHDDDMDRGKPEWGNGNPNLKNAVRLFPNHYQGEGHFICTLVKDNDELKQELSTNNLNLEVEQQKLLKSFIDEYLINVNFMNLQSNKNILYSLALVTRKNRQLHLIRNGLKLGEFKKNRFEPNHALVMSLNNNQFKQIVDLSEINFKKFIHGEVINIDNNKNYKGWAAISYQNKVFSWGKVVQNQVKNFYPKGLRQ